MKKLTLFALVITVNISFSQFTDFQSPFTGRLTSGDFAVESFGNMFSWQAWICGDSGTVMKIYTNWNPPRFRMVDGDLPSALMLGTLGSVDTNIAVTAGVTGSTTFAYRTSNAGANWIQVFAQTGGRINGIWFKSQQVGLMTGNPVGGRWSLFRTTNGGVSWDSAGMYLAQTGGETGFLNSIFTRGDSVWMGTDNSRIYFSTNFGYSWSAKSTPGVQNNSSVCYDFGYQGYAGGDSLVNSTNYGNTWSVVPNILGSGQVTGIVGSNPGVDLSSFPVFYSKANVLYYGIGGWQVFHAASSGVYTYLFKLRPNGNGQWGNASSMLGLMNDGKVWVCNCAWGAVTSNNSIIPIEFKLYQNFPNPFNPITKIKFDIPSSFKNGSVRLVIYNSLGEEVMTLLNSELNPGIHEVDFDGSELASGIYIYNLTAGSFQGSGKMLLVK